MVMGSRVIYGMAAQGLLPTILARVNARTRTPLTATGIVYDQSNDRLIIDGPIVLTDGKGSVILASQAEMRADLTEGLLTSARMVLQQQLQLAAAEIQRVDGRYTSMSKVVASSCKVCDPPGGDDFVIP